MTPPCFPVNIFQILQKVMIFFSERGGVKDIILTYLDSSRAEVFPHGYLFFSVLVIFRRKRVVKVGPKVLTLGPSFFHKHSSPSKNFQTTFLFVRVLLLVRISAILDHIGGVRVKYLSKRTISWMLNRYAKFWKFLT